MSEKTVTVTDKPYVITFTDGAWTVVGPEKKPRFWSALACRVLGHRGGWVALEWEIAVSRSRVWLDFNLISDTGEARHFVRQWTRKCGRCGITEVTP